MLLDSRILDEYAEMLAFGVTLPRRLAMPAGRQNASSLSRAPRVRDLERCTSRRALDHLCFWQIIAAEYELPKDDDPGPRRHLHDGASAGTLAMWLRGEDHEHPVIGDR